MVERNLSPKVQNALKKFKLKTVQTKALNMIRAGSYKQLKAEFQLDLNINEWQQVGKVLEMWSSDN